MGNNKNKIPNYIREQFTCLFGDSLLANPGEVWNSSDVISDGDITRQLIFFAQSKDVFIMVYEGGGWGSSTHMIFMRFLDKRLIDLWCGTNGYIDATYKFNSVKDILSFVQKNKHTKWAFNTNFVYY